MTPTRDTTSAQYCSGAVLLTIGFILLILLFFARTTCRAQPASQSSPKASVSAADIKKMLAPWQQALDKTRRDVVLIELKGGKDDVFRSKVGGAPYLPAGSAVPTGSSGDPLYLLAQINFEEVPPMPDFPRKGMLQFFIADDDYYGANIENHISEQNLMKQKNYRVVYHAAVSRDGLQISAAAAAGEVENLPFEPSNPLLMIFTKTSETITADDAGFEAVLGKSFYDLVEELAKKYALDEDSLSDALSDFLEPNAFDHKIGGYPSFAQEDPRSGASPLRLLLQLSSDDSDGDKLMWGDSGVAGFFIDPKDMQRSDYSKVLYNWDCY